MNIAEVEMQRSDLISVPFDHKGFALDFIEIFNPPKATLTKLRKEADGKLIKDGELLWARKLNFHVAEPQARSLRFLMS